MRNERHFGMSRDAALAFLAQAPVIHIATTTPDGAPVLRTLDFAWTGDALYTAELRNVLVLRVRPELVDGKAKLGQNRTPAERRKIVEGLRRRGAPGDEAAIAAILEACAEAAPV